MRRALFFSFLMIGLSACAQLPQTDPTLIAAMEAHGPQGHLELLRQEGERVTNTPFEGGNKVTLIRDGDATYKAMAIAIRSAHRRIDMESYMFTGIEAHLIGELLVQASDRGVDVNLIYDAWGSSDESSSLYDHLRANGVHVVEFNPVDPLSVADTSFNHRDHRKLLIIDNRLAMTGGVNITNEYTRHGPFGSGGAQNQGEDADELPMRDTEVQIQGPVVGEFERIFMTTWNDQSGPPLPPPPPPPSIARGDLEVEALSEAPDMKEAAIYRSLLVAISLARSSIHMTMAFFVPPHILVEALKRAAHRGVDVTLILPVDETPEIAFEAGHGYYEELMESGVKIYERENAVLHSKTVVIDGIWSTVGSANFDWRSVVFNDEVNAVILGRAFGDQMEIAFKSDLAASRYVDPKEWSERPWTEVIKENLARLGESLL